MEEKKIGEKFLPVGTVLLLRDGTKKVMITGFCAIAEENKNRIFDYSGCLYPEGFISVQTTILFDHDQISEVFYMGYVDEEEKKFKEKLNEVIKNKEIETTQEQK